MKRTFFNSKSKDKQYLVIGCGRFGSSVAKKMCQLGNEVMVIDKDEDSINNIAELVTHTAIVDAVSYTHLDVYKRQWYDNERHSNIIYSCNGIWNNKFTIYKISSSTRIRR